MAGAQVQALTPHTHRPAITAGDYDYAGIVIRSLLSSRSPDRKGCKPCRQRGGPRGNLALHKLHTVS